jgi:hypothetical protein
VRAAALLLFIALQISAKDLKYWIEPRAGGDPQLAQWALEAWERVSHGSLHFVPTNARDEALLRVLWVTGPNGLYGEARPIIVNGQRGAELYVRPEMDGLGPDIEAAASKDRLLRDAIVYLTCLHESGHGLGLPHTSAFEDIMYSFGYGGDINEYFGRYRHKLSSRDDIRKNSGISSADEQHLRELFSPPPPRRVDRPADPVAVPKSIAVR